MSHCVIATFIYCVLYRCNEDILHPVFLYIHPFLNKIWIHITLCHGHIYLQCVVPVQRRHYKLGDDDERRMSLWAPCTFLYGIARMLSFFIFILSWTKFEFLAYCAMATFIYSVLYRCNEDILPQFTLRKCLWEFAVHEKSPSPLYSSFLKQNLNSQHNVPGLSTVCCTGATKTFYTGKWWWKADLPKYQAGAQASSRSQAKKMISKKLCSVHLGGVEIVRFLAIKRSTENNGANF